MKKYYLIIAMICTMSQFGKSQTLVIFDENGVGVGYPLNSIDSIYFTHTKCPLDDEFDINPLENGWNYTNKRNSASKIAFGNSSFWVADSLYGTVVWPQGIEIEKELDEVITTLFEMTAKAIISTNFQNTSPIVTFGIKNGKGDLIYHVELTSDSLFCCDHGTKFKSYSIVNNPDPSISISWYTDKYNSTINYYINGQFKTNVDCDRNLSISKTLISIKSNFKNNLNEARVDFIKVCRK